MFVFMHMYSEILSIPMSATMSSTQNLNLRMTQIGIRCSGTKKFSHRYQINHCCQACFSRTQPSEKPIEVPPELPAELSIELSAKKTPEILFEVAVSNSDTKLPF